MTKKDFELIASIIEYYCYDTTQFNTLVVGLANGLAEKYPKFKKDKFLIACGMKREQGNENISCNYCAGMTGKEREQEQHQCYERV